MRHTLRLVDSAPCPAQDFVDGAIASPALASFGKHPTEECMPPAQYGRHNRLGTVRTEA
jgi:hypothetical protein